MQTEGLFGCNNAIVTKHHNPSVSLTLNTSPYTGEAEGEGKYGEAEGEGKYGEAEGEENMVRQRGRENIGRRWGGRIW